MSAARLDTVVTAAARAVAVGVPDQIVWNAVANVNLDFMRRVDYVIWYVESLERSVVFYRDVIGLAVRIEGDGYVEFDLDNTKFSLFERSKLPELIGREGGTTPCGEIGFLVDDVDAEADRLRGLGVELLTGPVDRPWQERTLHIADPDGNVIEYAQKLRARP